PPKAASPKCPRRYAACGLSPSSRHHSREAPFFRGLDALAVDDADGRLGLFAGGLPDLAAQLVVEELDGPIITPPREVVVNAVPLGKVRRQHAPLAAGAQQIEDRVEHGAHGQLALAAAELLRGYERFDKQPLLVREVGRVVGSHANLIDKPRPQTGALLNRLLGRPGCSLTPPLGRSSATGRFPNPDSVFAPPDLLPSPQ